MRACPSFVLAFVLALLAAPSIAPSIALAQPLIVIDAGHGGSDPGAVGCSLEEANVVLDVSTRLRTELERAGIRVALTRDVDEFVGLSARAAFANSMSADGFVSVHSNANSGTPATGTETWISNSAGARSLELATLLQAQMVASWGLRDRGVKRADFVVVRDTTMPAALTELAFTNNCAADATRLGSPTDRQAMAEAQARAILEWLGVMPGMNGTLRGVVFEDQGVGTMDLSVRLPGAMVRIVETGDTATGDSPDAAWLFDLPAGTYTVEASAPGHTTASRSCDVTSGGTTWCSIGLFPTSLPEPDASVPPMPDAFVVVVEDDDAGTVTPRPDAASLESPDAGLVARPNAGDCACRASTQRGGSAWMLVVAGLVIAGVLRRRRAIGLAVATSATLAVILMSCTGPEATHAPLVTDEAVPEPIVGHVVDGTPITIVSERELLLTTSDGTALTAPMISPDGRTLLLATPDFAALHAWRDGALTTICETQHCGHEPRFFGAGLVATRTPEQSASAIPGDAYTLDGQPSTTRLGCARRDRVRGGRRHGPRSPRRPDPHAARPRRSLRARRAVARSTLRDDLGAHERRVAPIASPTITCSRSAWSAIRTSIRAAARSSSIAPPTRATRCSPAMSSSPSSRARVTRATRSRSVRSSRASASRRTRASRASTSAGTRTSRSNATARS
jgi:MYXO-CTERM domain-containing protein